MKRVVLFLLFSLVPTLSWANTAWIVLIPGAASSGDQLYLPPFPTFFNIRYFSAYEDALGNDGFNFIVCPKTRDQDSRTIEDREEECANQISALDPAGDPGERDVVILGHSTGGLVARELAQDVRVKDRIKSVLLFSTPNQGTILADYVLDEESQGINPISMLAGASEFTEEKKHYLPELRSVRFGLSTDLFASQDVIDNPDVSYSSISTSFQSDFNDMDSTRLIINAQLVANDLDKTPYGIGNDGVVPLYSEVYGNYLGNIEINHGDGPCSDLVRLGPDCHKALSFVLPVLESEAQIN